MLYRTSRNLNGGAPTLIPISELMEFTWSCRARLWWKGRCSLGLKVSSFTQSGTTCCPLSSLGNLRRHQAKAQYPIIQSGFGGRASPGL